MQSTQTQSLPVLICIDIEPQQRAVDLQVRQDWIGFPETWEFLDNIRSRLARATHRPVRFNWFLRMDPQISETYGAADWAVTRYPTVFDKLLLAQDELGLHPHVWRLDQEKREWYVDFEDHDWVEHCVAQSFDQFLSTFSTPCRSFRFGDRWLDDRTVHLIERLGARFDLTIESGRKGAVLRERFTGFLPDYSSAPRLPYQPSTGNYLRPGEGTLTRTLCMIPVSTVDPYRALRGLQGPATAATSEIDGGPRRYEGHLDSIDQCMLIGWVYDSNAPDETISVEVFDNNRLAGTYPAATFRHDLLLEGKGSGAHGFFIPTPIQWWDGELHQISIKAAGSDFELIDSPQDLRLEEKQTKCDHYTMNLAENSELFAKGLDALLVDEQLPYLNLVLRTDAISRPSGRAYLHQNFERLISHPLAGRFLITTPHEAMRILEAYTSIPVNLPA